MRLIFLIMLLPCLAWGSVTVTVNGSNHTIPQTNERGWGNAVTAWIQAITSYTLQPTGGTFTLSSDVNFGATYGLKGAYFSTRTANPSSSGLLRMAVTDTLGWRNNANSGNLLLAVDASNNMTFNAVAVPTISSTSTLTNKTIDAASNTISNIANANVAAAAAIAYSKLNLGSSIVNADVAPGAAIAINKLATTTVSRAIVSDGTGVITPATTTAAEIGYVNGVTSSVQTQLDARISKSFLTAKGSLISASASSTPAEILIGSDGQVPVADSTQTSGIGWSNISGVKNYVTNGDATSATTGWATYADAAAATPVDGTAGAPTLTLTRSTATPLRGAGSFLITKDAVNRQGNGASYDFTIDVADKAKPIQISFDYQIASGTFSGGTSSTDSDLEVYIYDVTNATLIQPSAYKMDGSVASTNYGFKGSFQASSSSVSYRLIIHAATTSASAYTVKFDNVVVGPIVSTTGVPASDWVSKTMTLTNAGNGTVSARMSRVADTAWFQGTITVGSSLPTSTITLNLPSGMTIDSAKSNGLTMGIAGASNSGGSGSYTGQVRYDTATSVIFYGDSNATYWSPTVPRTFAAGDRIDFTFSVAIVGWSSNVQMSNDTDTRVVAASYSASGAISWTATGGGNFDTKLFDTHSAVTTGANAWKFTAPLPGIYRVAATIQVNASSQVWDIYKNGTAYKYLFKMVSSANNLAGGSMLIQLVAGDYIDLRLDSSTATGDASASGNTIHIERISGPSQIAASETIAAKYYISADRVPGTSQVNYDTKDIDTHSAVTTGAAWKYTAPGAGIYKISLTSHPSVAGGGNLTIYKNGVVYAPLTSIAGAYANTTMSGNTLINLVAGDYIDIRPDTTGSTLTSTITGTGPRNSISIERVSK